VLGLDTNEAQVAALAAGRLPFHEPELQKLLEAGCASAPATPTPPRSGTCTSCASALRSAPTPTPPTCPTS
jgi:UDP-glucose 6-dehydrogenase